MKVAHIKWVLVAIVVGIFLPWMILVHSRETSSQEAIESEPKFDKPTIPLKFQKNIQWDPQSFLGRGRSAGFWDWSPKGVVLTNKGENLFTDHDGVIGGALLVGKREITTVKSVQPKPDGSRDVLFLFRWTELTDMTKLLSSPPVIGKEYEALATLVEGKGGWQVKTLTTPDFSRSLDILTTEMSR